MNRKSFIKNSLMAIAMTLLPKVLRPMDTEVVDEPGDYLRNFGMLIPERVTYQYLDCYTWEIKESDSPISATITLNNYGS